MGYIYIVQSGDYHKIGQADDLQHRLKSLQTGNPNDLIVTHYFEADQPTEAEDFMHRMFRHKRVRGEWFLLSDSDLNFIRTIGGFVDSSFTWLTRPVPRIDTNRPEATQQVVKVVDYQGRVYHLTEGHLADFLRAAWRRQQEGKKPLSRRYWTLQRRPQLEAPMYQAIIRLLEGADLIINRKPQASGQLVAPPEEAMRRLLNGRGERPAA